MVSLTWSDAHASTRGSLSATSRNVPGPRSPRSRATKADTFSRRWTRRHRSQRLRFDLARRWRGHLGPRAV